MQVETVKIKSTVSDENPHGYIVINKDDLTKEHELFKEDGAEESPGEADRKAERAAMSAFLKESGVSVAKNATDEVLRAKVDEIKAAQE